MVEIKESVFKKRWFKNIGILLVIIILGGGGYLIYNGYTINKENEALFDVSPSMGEARTRNLEVSVPADGNIGVDDITSVVLADNAIIDETLVFEGQEVKAGDVLFTYDIEGMGEILEGLYDELVSVQLSIATSRNSMETLYVKAPIDGVMKSVYLEADDVLEDAILDNGFVAVVALDNRMIVDIGSALSSFEVDDTIKVKTEGYTYTATVTLREGKKVAAFETTARSLGSSALVYDTSYNELGEGELEYYQSVNVSAVRGQITRVNVSNNDEVIKGDIIYTATAYMQSLRDLEAQEIDLNDQISELEALLLNPSIISPIDGIITMISDETVTTGNSSTAAEEAIVTIASTESWLLQVEVDELDIADIRIGQIVTVMIDALLDTDITGEVIKISAVGAASGGITTYETTVRILAHDGIRVAMTASAEIIVESKMDVLAIPIDAVRYLNGEPYVMVYVQRTSAEIENIKQSILSAQSGDFEIDVEAVKSGALSEDEMAEIIANRTIKNTSVTDQLYGEMREVTIGMSDASYIEILSGLSLDEKVVLPETISSTSSIDDIKAAYIGQRPDGGFGGGMGGGIGGGIK